MFVKTAVIMAVLITSYVSLVFFEINLFLAIIAAITFAVSSALVGFNIMHDANHGSYSKNKKINGVLSYTLELVGASNWLWRHKHNILHHTYTNIDELDDDIHLGGLMRLSPVQKRHSWHRFQHIYAFPAYSLLTIIWVTFGDLYKLVSGRIGEYKLPKPTLKNASIFFVSKSLYYFYTLILPMFFHPIWLVIIFFIATHLLLGFITSIVFQLAHTVEGNSFPSPDPSSGQIENEWAIHEVETTANFARRNKLATWMLGGLNFQIEHHLFPRICHVHYPEISKIVEQTCKDFGISYLSYPSVRAAVGAHVRFLKQLGRGELAFS